MLIFVLLVLIVVGLGMSMVGPDAVAPVVFPILWLVGWALAIAGRSNGDRQILARLFTVSFLLRVLVAIAVYRFGLVAVFGDEDSSGWSLGWEVAQAWRGDFQFAPVHPDLLASLYHSNQGYLYIAGGFLYLIGAPSRLALVMLSALAGALTVVLVYRIADKFFGQAAAEKAGLWAAVFPNLVVWSAQTLKEPFVILCECAIVYAVVRLRERVSLRTMGFLMLSLFGLYTMRFYAAFLGLAAAVLGLMIPAGARRGATLLAGAMMLTVAIAGLFASGLAHVEEARLKEQLTLSQLQSFRMDVATGEASGSGILLPYDVSSPVGAVLSFPASLASFLLSPYPWQVPQGSLRLKLSFIDVLLWWWMIPKVLAGLREAWRTQPRSVVLLLLFIVPLIVLYSLLFGNAGLAFRQRAQILALLLVFAGLGVTARKPGALSHRAAPIRGASAHGVLA